MGKSAKHSSIMCPKAMDKYVVMRHGPLWRFKHQIFSGLIIKDLKVSERMLLLTMLE